MTDPHRPAMTTQQVRLKADLVAMLRGIKFFDGGDMPDIVDPLIRPGVTERFYQLPAEIRRKVLRDAGLPASMAREPVTVVMAGD